MDPVPNPLLLRKSGNAGNSCSQELWPLDHRGDECKYRERIYQSEVQIMWNSVGKYISDSTVSPSRLEFWVQIHFTPCGFLRRYTTQIVWNSAGKYTSYPLCLTWWRELHGELLISMQQTVEAYRIMRLEGLTLSRQPALRWRLGCQPLRTVLPLPPEKSSGTHFC
jgi:hypothetical protein